MEKTGKLKEYWIFENEPHAKKFTFFAETKHSALKQYNEKFHTDYKMVSERRAMGGMNITIVEKSAYLHYDFRKFSYAITESRIAFDKDIKRT